MKKIIKYIGSLLTIAAIISIVLKIRKMDLDFSEIFDVNIVLPCLFYLIVQTTLIFASALPWGCFVEMLSGKKIPKKESFKVFAKSSILKYVPGNVFQYVGRNQVAIDMKISHVDVAMASVLDIGFTIISVLILSAVLLKSEIISLLEFASSNITAVVAIAGAVLLAALILFIKFKTAVISYLKKCVQILTKANIKKVIFCLLYYLGSQVILLFAYYFLMIRLVPDGTSDSLVFLLLGGYFFAWLLGFVMPGSPGGIGIRETVMLTLSSEIVDSNSIMLYVLLLRILSIIADIIAFLISLFIKTGVSDISRRSDEK